MVKQIELRVVPVGEYIGTDWRTDLKVRPYRLSRENVGAGLQTRPTDFEVLDKKDVD